MEKLLLQVLESVFESHEFKSLLHRKAAELALHILPKSQVQQSTTETLVGNIGTQANLDPSGLAWQFRSKLTRPPNSQEDIDAIAEMFREMIANKRTTAQAIYDTLQKRGRSSEPIWKFCERFAKTDNRRTIDDTLSRAAQTKSMLDKAGL